MDVCYCLLTHTWRCARSRVWRSRVLWCPLQVAGHRSTPALKINELQSHNFPPCLLDDVSSASREPVEAGHMKTAPAEASRLKIDCSFIPFCLTLMHQLWSGHYPTAGDWNASSSWERSSKMRNEAASKHPASFTVRFHVAVSQLFNFFFLILYGLIGPVGEAAAPPVMCWILSPQFSEMIRSLTGFLRRLILDHYHGTTVLKLTAQRASSSCRRGAEYIRMVRRPVQTMLWLP